MIVKGAASADAAFVDIYHPQKRYGIIYTDPPWGSAPNFSGGEA
jgi:hypothetical protein